MEYVDNEENTEYRVGDVIKEDDKIYLVVDVVYQDSKGEHAGYALVNLTDNHISGLVTDYTKFVAEDLTQLTREMKDDGEFKLSGKITFEI